MSVSLWGRNVGKSVYTLTYPAQEKRDRNVYTLERDTACVISGLWPERAVSRESAGAAIRGLRESRDWSLADLAAATGVSIMGLSFIERGARKPHKSTVQKVENGLGLPPGTYSRLLVAADPDAELARLVAAQPPDAGSPRRPGAGG